jgi:uncharacterized protein (UPF0548 family)
LRSLGERRPIHDLHGSTAPAEVEWASPPTGWRRYEKTVQVGSGAEEWVEAAASVLTWGVKTRSGFRVEGADSASRRVREGDRYWLIARLGPFRVREPVLVVAVVDEPDRCGFAYGTLEGHPVSGEEAFIVHRDSDERVWLTLRSITRAGSGVWRVAFPAVQVVQRWYRWRYQRALC